MDKKQHIAIFTTASLPWMTGTAVNPLFRAAYLSKDGERKVTLVIPWLSMKDQGLVYPSNITFISPSEQEKYVRRWLEERTGFTFGFSIRFYPGRFSKDKRSILAAGDISEIIPDEEADIAVLEEPEHLTWYHHGKRWKIKFRMVIGIIHTNYLEYVKREKKGMQAFLLKIINSWVVGIYCHKVIRLSAATQDYPKSIICNVHGVNPKFLEIYKEKIEQQQNGKQVFTKGAYYIGKMVWNKGYKELLKLLHDHQKELAGIEVDLYGNGEDSDQVQEAAKKLELAVRVHPGRDHADPLFHDFKVFLNPSTTDVVCTTTAEALAMGKIVVCANHPSNEFFKQFPNCWTYDDSNGFVEATCKALAEEPAQLTDAQRHELSWEAATERFLKVTELDQVPTSKPLNIPQKNFMSTSFNFRKNMEDASAYVHYVASGSEASRKVFGAIPGSLQANEQQCKELGLAIPAAKRGSRK
ncbi:digalactosyldiacylglycerol synthase 2, chloroplastic [Juglans microcarpa x Juglans regia]|uniref:digalactosyldiacylglycerol synthase 2, chloroplastic n=1 Tax=Juglans microcarpa x Juglans regia TaxID=2249226 RepID=UPI001B7F0C23|nr:digalactosyldiacylglycerol synthase 2, chloroplastic [Juglans microcarpa x Juglans regia]XP_041026167.1 digalactosyldiacylglycerol synthase 2, chloroplastic [Juglans microcarpa x Juglans regia]